MMLWIAALLISAGLIAFALLRAISKRLLAFNVMALGSLVLLVSAPVRHATEHGAWLGLLAFAVAVILLLNGLVLFTLKRWQRAGGQRHPDMDQEAS